jgi:hypothetical protein
MINIGWPEGIWIGLAIAHLMVTAAVNGKPRSGEHNFAVTFMSMLLVFGLLYWGGFFA